MYASAHSRLFLLPGSVHHKRLVGSEPTINRNIGGTMLPYGKSQSGTIVATASTPQDIQISSMNPPTFFRMRNVSQWGGTSISTTPAAADVEFWWQRSMTQGTAKGLHQAITTGALNTLSLLSDGVSFYNTATPPSFTVNASVTAVTKGAAGGVTVVTVTNDGNVARGPKINVGDYVRLINILGMEQVSGMVVQVLAITSTTSITVDLDSSGFAVSGTTGSIRKVIPSRMYPKAARIISVSQANPCVVELVQDSNFTVGEEVSFRIPPNSGTFQTMQQLNNLKGVVTVVTPATATTCSSITVAIDTSGFSAFTLPTSAQWLQGIGSQPQSLVVPAGSGVVPNQNPPGTNLLDAFDNRNIWVLHLGGSIFANSVTGDVWEWEAVESDEYNNQ